MLPDMITHSLKMMIKKLLLLPHPSENQEKNMTLKCHPLFLTILILQLAFFPRNIKSDDTSTNFVNFHCSDSNFTYTTGTTFQTNLNTTLFSLLPAAARFNNASLGAGVDRVNALYLCRGDLDLSTCHNCVQSAAKTVLQRCPLYKEGIVWYEECFVRYSNTTIFAKEAVDPHQLGDRNHTAGLWSSTNLDPYREEISTALDGLIKRVANELTLQGFGTAEVKLSETRAWVWRGLAQCTPDILGSGCEDCLRTGYGQWDGWPNTMIFMASCILRFDLYGSPPPPPPPIKSGSGRLKIILIVVPLAAIALILLLAGFYFWRKHCCKLQRESTHSYTGEQPEIDEIVEPRTTGAKCYSYSEVHSMTDGFQRQLGEGGYGCVYYGVLSDGYNYKEVAVKLLSKDAPKQFSAEIAVFGKISHKNLVSLIGFCEEPNNLALVYEYMAGGDLKALLSGSESLSWKTRLGIAIDSAQGLDYLHNGCRIVHRDVKTQNILLNQHHRAKIADFGFSKIFPDDYVSALSTRVIGTPGYLDPQYHLTGQLNERSDVYSFGVVLLELITGKAAMVKDKPLVQWVKPMLERGDIESIIDHRLPGVVNRTSLWRVIDLAMECVKYDAADRPTMGQIVTELKECLSVELDERTSTGGHPSPVDAMNLSVSTVIGPAAR